MDLIFTKLSKRHNDSIDSGDFSASLSFPSRPNNGFTRRYICILARGSLKIPAVRNELNCYSKFAKTISFLFQRRAKVLTPVYSFYKALCLAKRKRYSNERLTGSLRIMSYLEFCRVVLLKENFQKRNHYKNVELITKASSSTALKKYSYLIYLQLYRMDVKIFLFNEAVTKYGRRDLCEMTSKKLNANGWMS